MNPIQRSFGRGEISPALAGRADLDLYKAALSTQLNFITPKSGGVQNRAGTEFVGQIPSAEGESKQIPFIFSADDAYSLVFGHLYMRVIRNGAFVTATAQNITAISVATPCVVTLTAHGYSNGDYVYINTTQSVAVGMPELSGQTFVVSSQTANTFRLNVIPGDTNISSATFTAYVSGGTVAKIYSVTTVFSASEVAALDYAQYNDMMVLTHPSHPPQKLVRSGHASWAISNATFGPTGYTAVLSVTAAASAGAEQYSYMIAVVDTDGNEGLPSMQAQRVIAAITTANPAVVTSTAHGYGDGDELFFDITGGMPEIHLKRLTISIVDADHYNLIGVNSTLYTPFTNGSSFRDSVTISAAAAPSTTTPIVLSWVQPPYTVNPKYVNVYRSFGGIFGKIGISYGTSFSDIGYDPDTSDTPYLYTDNFSATDDYPSAAAFHQQRLILANSNNNPQTVWCSRVGDYFNFSPRGFVTDNDAITAAIAGNSVDPIRRLVPLRVLLAMSMSSEVVIEGSSGETFSPGAISIHHDSQNGSGTIKPLVVNNTILFVQKDLRTLRDLFYNFQANSYDGSDVSALASSLFRGVTVVDMAYQKAPDSIIWLVLSDGTLVACTYIKDQSILAFSEHTTDGTVESVCCIPEGDETALYLTVNRGHTYSYVERMASRTVQDPTDIRDMVFVDSALSFDGRNTGAVTMTLTGASYSAGDYCTLVASVARFASYDIGNSIFLNGTDSDGEPVTVHCEITAYTNSTTVTVQLDKSAPSSLQAIATTDWARAVDEVRGLWHLEGQNISIQGDGWVIANPNNDDYDVITVSSGRVTLPEPHAVIHAGLPYVSDLVTCDIDRPQGTTIMHRGKLVNSVTLYVNDTREFWAGETLPDDDSKDGLKPSRQHVTGETTDAPPALFSEPMIVNIKGRWNEGGRVAVRNIDPLPCEIIAISPDFHVGS